MSVAPGDASARQMQGKELSFNNVTNTDAAFELVADFPTDQPVFTIMNCTSRTSQDTVLVEFTILKQNAGDLTSVSVG